MTTPVASTPSNIQYKQECENTYTNTAQDISVLGACAPFLMNWPEKTSESTKVYIKDQERKFNNQALYLLAQCSAASNSDKKKCPEILSQLKDLSSQFYHNLKQIGTESKEEQSKNERLKSAIQKGFDAK